MESFIAARGTGIELELRQVGPQERPPLSSGKRYEFLVALNGRASLAAMGRARVFNPPDAALVLPGERWSLRGSGQSRAAGARVARLSFTDSWAAEGQHAWLVRALADRTIQDRMNLGLGTEAFASLVRKIEGYAAGNGGPTDTLRGPLRGPLAESLFLDLSLEFLREDEERREESVPHWLRAACASMESRKNLLAGGGRLAELSGKSREHVIRQMRRYYGMTPTQYVNELRLRTASRLLVESDRPVLDIGYSLGFQNPSYFAQLFKEKFGMPPTRFRAVRRP